MKRFDKLPKTPQGIQAVKAAKKRRLKPKFNIHVDTSGWLFGSESMRNRIKELQYNPKDL